MTGLRANEVEEGLLAVICDAMLKPENFAAYLEIFRKRNRIIHPLPLGKGEIKRGSAFLSSRINSIQYSWPGMALKIEGPVEGSPTYRGLYRARLASFESTSGGGGPD